MKLFNLRIDTLLLRYYLMMLVVIVAGFSGLWSLAFLALPIFMTCLLGVDLRIGEMRRSRRILESRLHSWIRHLRPPVHHTA